MSWKGMAIGGYIGSFFGGPLGALIGAVLGHKIEGAAFGGKHPSSYASMSAGNRSMIFCASAAAMFAKMAKADGVVKKTEIEGIENAFRRLGFTPAARRYAVDAFRKAKNDSHSIYDYAREFARAVDSVEVCEVFYEILWDIARADGTATPEEHAILQRITRALGIRPEWYAYFASARSGGSAVTARDELAHAYSVLGASANDNVATLRRKYRELAKKNHPDALRARGLPAEMIGKATERMSRINAAWATIKGARGL